MSMVKPKANQLFKGTLASRHNSNKEALVEAEYHSLPQMTEDYESKTKLTLEINSRIMVQPKMMAFLGHKEII